MNFKWLIMLCMAMGFATVAKAQVFQAPTYPVVTPPAQFQFHWQPLDPPPAQFYWPSQTSTPPEYISPQNATNPTPTTTPSQSPESRHGSYTQEGTCMECYGTGNCPNCHGRGIDSSFGVTHECGMCKGKKVCWKCNGTGKVTKTVHY